MLNKEELYKQPEYWLEKIQNELYRQLEEYRLSKGFTKTQLAEEFGVSKGYISQVLNGQFNHTLKKLVELSLAINKIPDITFTDKEIYLKAESAYSTYHENIQTEFLSFHITNADKINIGKSERTLNRKYHNKALKFKHVSEPGMILY